MDLVTWSVINVVCPYCQKVYQVKIDKPEPLLIAEAAIDILKSEKEYKRIIIDQLNTIATLKAALRASLAKEHNIT